MVVKTDSPNMYKLLIHGEVVKTEFRTSTSHFAVVKLDSLSLYKLPIHCEVVKTDSPNPRYTQFAVAKTDSHNFYKLHIRCEVVKMEAVFSPNPMWYRPIWPCDFRCTLHGLQSSGLSLTFSCQLPICRLDCCSMEILSALVCDV